MPVTWLLEVVVLTTMGKLVSTGLLLPATASGSGGARPPIAIEGDAAQTAQLVWKFDLPGKGAVESSPVVVGERVYIAAAHDNAFRPYGALYCLERGTGKEIWRFNNGEKMKQVFSTPMVVGDLLYIGEGFHQDAFCKIYCLNAGDRQRVLGIARRRATPNRLRPSRTVRSTAAPATTVCTVSTPRRASRSGTSAAFTSTRGRSWRMARCTAAPALATCTRRRSSSVSTRRPGAGELEDFATPQPVWSTASVDGRYVYVGMGNGRLNDPDPHPEGQWCASTRKTRAGKFGGAIWTTTAYCRLARIDAGYVYFGCNDKQFYCV